MNEAIKISNVWAGYQKTSVLENINLTVKTLDFIGIIGPNGGGKTTLLKLLLGLIKPFEGDVKIMDYPAHQGRRYIGYVPQLLDFDRNFPLLVKDVVIMGRLGQKRLLQPYNKKDWEIVHQCLEQVGMAHLKDRPINQLSGGERQRVYIARALASKPMILILDEPTANVDSKIQNNIYELLEQLNQTLTILMVSHDLGAISRHVKTVACLNRRLFYHEQKTVTTEMIEDTYKCPIDLIAHGVPHRVFSDHQCSHITEEYEDNNKRSNIASDKKLIGK